jgi:hypothetical protein
MPQLIAEQVLIVLHVGLEPKGPERPSALGEKVGDAPIDQDSNEVVVKRPSRLVASRHGSEDQTCSVVDDGYGHCQRSTAFIASDHDRRFRP